MTFTRKELVAIKMFNAVTFVVAAPKMVATAIDNKSRKDRLYYK